MEGADLRVSSSTTYFEIVQRNLFVQLGTGPIANHFLRFRHVSLDESFHTYQVEWTGGNCEPNVVHELNTLCTLGMSLYGRKKPPACPVYSRRVSVFFSVA